MEIGASQTGRRSLLALFLLASFLLGLALAQGPAKFNNIELVEGLWQDIELNRCSTFAAVDADTLAFYYFPANSQCTVKINFANRLEHGEMQCMGKDMRMARVILTHQGTLEIISVDPENQEDVKTWIFKQCSFDEAAMLGDMYLIDDGDAAPKSVVRSFKPAIVDDANKLTRYHYSYVNDQGINVDEYFFYGGDSTVNAGKRIVGGTDYPFLYWMNPDGSYLMVIVIDPREGTEPSFDPDATNVVTEHYIRKPGEPGEGRYTYAVNFGAVSKGADFSCHVRERIPQTQTGNSYKYSWGDQECTEVFEKYTNRGKIQCVSKIDPDTVATLRPFIYNLEQDGSVTYVVSSRNFKSEDEFFYPNRYAILSDLNDRYTLYPCTQGYALRGSWSRQDQSQEACVHMIPVFEKTISIVEQDIQLVYDGDNAGMFMDAICKDGGCPFKSKINGPREFIVRVSGDGNPPEDLDKPKRETDRELIYSRCQFIVADSLYGNFLDENSLRVEMRPTTDINVRTFDDSDGFTYSEDVSEIFEGVATRYRIVKDGEEKTTTHLAVVFGADGAYLGLEVSDRQEAKKLANELMDTRTEAILGKQIHTYVPQFDSGPLYRGSYFHNIYDVCVPHAPTKRDRQASWIDPSKSGTGRCRIDLAAEYNGGKIECDSKINQFMIFSRDRYTGAFYVARGDSLAGVSLGPSHGLQLWKPCPATAATAFKGSLRAPVVFPANEVINFNKFDGQWGEYLARVLPKNDNAKCYNWAEKIDKDTPGSTIFGVDGNGNECEYTFGLQDGVGRTNCRFEEFPREDKDTVFYYQVSGLDFIIATVNAADNTVLPRFRHQSDKTFTIIISRCLPPKQSSEFTSNNLGEVLSYDASSVASYIGTRLVVQTDILEMGLKTFNAIGYESKDGKTQNRLVIRKDDELQDEDPVLDVTLLTNGQAIDNTEDQDLANGYWSVDHASTLYISLGNTNPVRSSQSTLGESYIIRRRLNVDFPLSKNSKWTPAGSTDASKCEAFKEIETNSFGPVKGTVRYNLFKNAIPGFGIQSSTSESGLEHQYAISYYYDDEGAFVVRRNGNPLDLDPALPAPHYDLRTVPEALKATFARHVPCVPVVKLSFTASERSINDFPLSEPIGQARLVSQLHDAMVKQTSPSLVPPDLVAFNSLSATMNPNRAGEFTIKLNIAAFVTGAVSTTAKDIVDIFKSIKTADIRDFHIEIETAEVSVDDSLVPSPPPRPDDKETGFSVTGAVFGAVGAGVGAIILVFVVIKFFYKGSSSGGSESGDRSGFAIQSRQSTYDSI